MYFVSSGDNLHKMSTPIFFFFFFFFFLRGRGGLGGVGVGGKKKKNSPSMLSVKNASVHNLHCEQKVLEICRHFKLSE